MAYLKATVGPQNILIDFETISSAPSLRSQVAMSFYTYYGKLDKELLVAILPNGTVEHDDPIYLFLNKRLSQYRAKDVSITEDGEDTFSFKDGYYNYKATSKKAHRELDLTVQSGSSNVSKVSLIRHYDQPLTAVPSSDTPKIWSGEFNFHQWAKNEPFMAIAPKGLGNGNPIISLWQWTKDAEGNAKTLSTSVSQQKSDDASPAAFSFEQNGYYIASCKVNDQTKGLNVTIKAPTNPDAVQNEFALSAEIKLGAEHNFAPPRAPQQKITLDCSLPRAAPSLTRFAGALPFPGDIISTLEYSAAYVDQAGYLAKYAVRQFDQLDRSYHQLEKKSEARSARNLKLEAEVAKVKESEGILKKQNTELQKSLDNSRNAENEKDEELKKALANLAISEALARKLKTLIATDKIEDLKRDKEYQAHINADHKAIDQLKVKLSDAQEAARKLQENLDDKIKIIAARDASLLSLGKQLTDAKADIEQLRRDLTAESAARKELETEVSNLSYHWSNAQKEAKASTRELADRAFEITDLKKDLAREQAKYRASHDDLEETEKTLGGIKARYEAKVKRLEQELADAIAHEKTHHPIRGLDGTTAASQP